MGHLKFSVPDKKFLPQFRRNIRILFTVCLIAGLRAAIAYPAVGTITNRNYQVVLKPDKAITVIGKGGHAQTFRPDFTVLYRPDRPEIKSVHGPAPVELFIPQWSKSNGGTTMDYFQVATPINVTASNASISASRIDWIFADQPKFILSAYVMLPGPGGEPEVTFKLTPKQDGYFSVGYTGAPQFPLSAVTALWQPDAWQEKRFPALPILSMENMCSLTAALLTLNGSTFGVAANPSDIPFRMPMIYNARCGVMIRNEAGLAQPMFFAPVMGETNSFLTAGTNYVSSFRITVRGGTVYDSFRHLASGLYGFRDFRKNTICSLNTTIENMIEFALDDYMARWNANLRGCDYSTDVSNTVKVVSALDPLSIAFITDRQDIFERRAVPMIEYLLSRQKFIFTTDTNQNGQGASAEMAGPTASVFEWASLFNFSQGRSSIFRHAAFQRFEHPGSINGDITSREERWVDELALYYLTGRKNYLASAEGLANNYIARRIDEPQTKWPDFPEAQFWTDFAPRWMQLFDLYTASHDKRYLDAAIAGAQSYATFCEMSPKVPEGDVTLRMTIYKSGTATVPAWRPSNVGLTSEAANTYTPWNPAIFLTTYAPWFLHIAALSDDPFFRDIARNAVVGRYANYPGYTINTEFSTAYESACYPLTPPPRNHRYSQFYFNHVWPQIAMLMDYLISDAVTRSDGLIDFPSRYAEGYAYIQSEVYGDRPGTFYGDTNVYLYMPRKAVEPDNIQINTISARGNGNFYVALLNQSAQPITTTITIDVPGLDAQKTYAVRTWHENQASALATLEHGKITLLVAGHGITAMAFDELNPIPSFQSKVFDTNATSFGDQSYVSFNDPGINQVNGMMMTFGRGLSSVYIWLGADASTLAQATLCYRFSGGEWRQMTDDAFPYEFHVPMRANDDGFKFYVQGKLTNGQTVSTPAKILWRRR